MVHFGQPTTDRPVRRAPERLCRAHWKGGGDRSAGKKTGKTVVNGQLKETKCVFFLLLLLLLLAPMEQYRAHEYTGPRVCVCGREKATFHVCTVMVWGTIVCPPSRSFFPYFFSHIGFAVQFFFLLLFIASSFTHSFPLVVCFSCTYVTVVFFVLLH